MSYRDYTDADLEKAVKDSTSFSQVLRKLNLVCAGGNFLQLKKNIARLNLDITHFKGAAWSKDLYLKDIGEYKKPEFIKKRLVSLRGKTCEVCKSDTWLGKPIAIELHHIDGNRLNNAESNLQLLCPNCHAQTTNYRRRKTK